MLKKELKREFGYLSDVEYFKIINECHVSLNLTSDEKQLLRKSPVARFIAGIPFISNESNPEILSCMNIISYIAGNRNNEFFSHRFNQTLKSRIEPYIHSVDGDENTINLCKVILEEVSLLDHNSDSVQDLKTGHSNPINDGLIDFEVEKKRLNEEKRTYPEHIQELVDGSFKGKVLSFFWSPY